MASDLFLSYARLDADAALALAEQLRADGFDLWIDQYSLDGAEPWSKAIVEAIRDTRAMLVVLSSNSVQSEHVSREVILASENRKPILPLDLEPVELPSTLAYPLAGLQRSPIEHHEAILRTLARLGIEPTAQGQPTFATLAPSRTTQNRSIADAQSGGPLPSSSQQNFSPMPADPFGRKSIAVLPFENLSDDADDRWFAEGLTQELISLLSQVRGIRVKDRKSVINYDARGKSLSRIADELGVQYVIEGTVRKHRSEIRVTAAVIDTATEDHLWSDTFKGSIEDLFGAQEGFALSVAESLKVSLTLEEQVKVSQKTSENLEALQSYVIATGFLESPSASRVAYKEILSAVERAITLDRRFTDAWLLLARARNGQIMNLGIDASRSIDAREAALHALILNPTSARAFAEIAHSFALEGAREDAYAAIEQAESLDPTDYFVGYKRGLVSMTLQDYPEALSAFELAFRQHPDDPDILLNAGLASIYAQDHAALSRILIMGQPLLERWVKLYPENYAVKAFYGSTLAGRQRFAEATEVATELLTHELHDEFEVAVTMMLLVILQRPDDAIDLGSRSPSLAVARRYITGPLYETLKASTRYELIRARMED